MPRSGETATGAFGAEDWVVVVTEAVAAAGLAAASISSFLILPPTPVPRTCERLTPSSLASFRTIGVT